jgi:hypothetical protein
MATLVRVPPLGVVQSNIVRTSVIEVMEVPLVATCAIGMVGLVKPVVLEAGAQLFEPSRYT